MNSLEKRASKSKYIFLWLKFIFHIYKNLTKIKDVNMEDEHWFLRPPVFDYSNNWTGKLLSSTKFCVVS